MKNRYIDTFNSRKTLQVFIKAFKVFKWALKDFIYGYPIEKCPPSRNRIGLGGLSTYLQTGSPVMLWFFNLALTDRNIQARFGLRVVWEF